MSNLNAMLLTTLYTTISSLHLTLPLIHQSNQVLCNDMLADWANDDSNSSHFRSVLPELNPSDDGGTSIIQCTLFSLIASSGT